MRILVADKPTRRVLLAGLASLLLAACTIHAVEPNADQKADDVRQLIAVLPLLDELDVRSWRDQDWCRSFSYQGGQFSTNKESDTCNLFEGTAEPFSPQALADLDRVKMALAASGVRVHIVRTDDWPRTERTTFELTAGDFDRFSYVHEPAYPPQQNLPKEWIATPINQDWYFVWEDWN